jgi:hypothetical protein
MSRPYERVYTVNDFWDGPRSGFADFDGKPHVYRSLWRDDLDDWDPEECFELRPVSAEALRAALEDWEIWCRWEDAFYAGVASESTRPALPEDRKRHDELAPIVQKALENGTPRQFLAVGDFRAVSPPAPGQRVPTGRLQVEVQWIPVEDISLAV